MNSDKMNRRKGHLDPDHLNQDHLNEDQFADCLIGLEPDLEVAAHLAGCEACREEMTRFGSSVNAFNRVAHVWSESRPMVSLRESSRSGSRGPRLALMVASWALAACAVVGVGVGVVLHQEQDRRAAGMASAVPVQEDSAAQIAQDNKLLLEVDQATRSDDSSVLLEYGLQPGQDATERTQETLRN